MSEDTKKRALLSEDELDNVAGGTTQENMDILNALEPLDPKGVQAVYDEAYSANGDCEKIAEIVGVGAYQLLTKHFKSAGLSVFTAEDQSNHYSVNGQSVTHSDVINELNKRAAQKDGWIVR